MKKLLIALLLASPALLFGQSKREIRLQKEAAEKAAIEKQIDSLKLIDGKAIIDKVVDVPNTPKDVIFTRLRGWFAKTFENSKFVIQENDMENGVLSGNGVFVTENYAVLTENNSYIKFFINARIKDNKFRYQITDMQFKYEHPSVSNRELDFNTILKDYRNGDDFYYYKLKYLIKLKNEIEPSILEAVVSPVNDINDF